MIGADYRIAYYATHEGNGEIVDAIGVLADGWIFWAWCKGGFRDENHLSEHVQVYNEHPSVQDGEYGVELCETVEELREVLIENEREDLLYMLEEPVFVVDGSKSIGGAHEKRATLAECVEMVRQGLDLLQEVYTLSEAAQKYGVSYDTLKTMIRRGKLFNHEYRKSGKTILVTRRGLEKLLQQLRKE